MSSPAGSNCRKHRRESLDRERKYLINARGKIFTGFILILMSGMWPVLTLACAVHGAGDHGEGVEVLHPPGILRLPQPGEGDELGGLGPVPEQPVEEDAQEAVQEDLGQAAEEQHPAPPP